MSQSTDSENSTGALISWGSLSSLLHVINIMAINNADVIDDTSFLMRYMFKVKINKITGIDPL